MEAYKFTIDLEIHGVLSTIYVQTKITSIGENEEEAYKKLKDNIKIQNIHKVDSRLIMKK